VPKRKKNTFLNTIPRKQILAGREANNEKVSLLKNIPRKGIVLKPLCFETEAKYFYHFELQQRLYFETCCGHISIFGPLASQTNR